MTQEELQEALVTLEQVSNEVVQPKSTTQTNEQGFYDEDLDI
jgi:hypothetical protein